jgi:signal transduction histidine kinase/DNA-binding NarL/FixJ family response regulator
MDDRLGLAGTSVAGPIIGRVAELRRLWAAIEDPDCNVAVLRGPAGAGKTVLAETALARARADGALTGSGKHAEGDAQSPYEPILQALSEALGHALEQLYEPAPVVADLFRALGPAAEALRRAGFRGLDGAPALTIGAAGRRESLALITEALLRLVAWLEGFNFPIVLMIDDWRRSTPESRAVLQTLAEARAGLTLLLIERDDAAPHELAACPGARTVEVGGLTPADRRALLVRLLGDGGPAAHAWLGPDGPVLPFDIEVAARSLTASGALALMAGRWQVDAALASPLSALSPGPGQGEEFDEPARRLALALAVWGDGAPARWLQFGLAMTAGDFDAATSRLEALGLARGRVDAAGARTLRFVHDRLRTQVLEDAGDAAPWLAGELADRLTACDPADWPSVAYAALHLRQAGGLEGVEAGAWRDRFAHGAAEARSRLDTAAASAFAENAWRLAALAPPPDVAGQRLMLREALLAAADRQDVESAKVRGAALIATARSDADLGEDQELAIGALRACGDTEAAWTAAVAALARRGLKTPSKVGLPQLIWARREWRRSQRQGARRTDGEAVGGMTRTAHAAATLAFERDPASAVYITCLGSVRARRDLRARAFWDSVDAYLSAVFGDFAEAACLGQRAVEGMAEDAVFRASALYRAYYFGLIWVRPMAELRGHCATIHDLALLEGDLATAMIAVRNNALTGWRTHRSLPELRRELEESLREAGRLGDATVLAGVTAFAQAAEIALQPPGAQPTTCGGEPATVESQALLSQPLVRLELASFQGDWIRAAALAREVAPLRRGADSHPGGVVWRFHETLARLKTGRRARRSDMAYIRKAAALNPVDHWPKLKILEAEMLRVRRPAAALEAYAKAVEAALATSGPLEAGLACECAAEAARAARRPDLAERYDAEAQTVWTGWGAAAKLDGVPADGDNGHLAAARAATVAAEREACAKSRFLADVAHELRTPLQGMQGLLDLAAEDRRTLNLTALRDVFASLRTIVDDLTDFGAVGSGEARLTAASVDIAALARSEVAVLAGYGEGRLALKLSEDLPALVESDGARVRQVLRNLLSNAVKYGEGGPIEVSVNVVAGDTPGAVEIEMVVDDGGPGLNDVELRRIFEPFERGAAAGDGRGFGLGLALSRRIAEQLGGSLNAENRAQGGARFTFQLPARLAETPPAAPADAVRTLVVLLAEDVALVRQVLAANLRRAGHQVHEAADGLEAWRLYRSQRFDLVILDWSMPGLGGERLLARMNGTGAQPRPPVIVLTASTDLAIAEAAHAAGAERLLRKPVSAGELASAVARVCGPAEAGVLPQAAFDREMAELRSAARVQLESRIGALVGAWREGAPLSADEAHRIAGLAAQFGWGGVAEAADRLEHHLRKDPAGIGMAAEAVAAAVASLPPAHHTESAPFSR